jgi:8-oxo-dGTP pyrophosphatase MutT (NUDIX family)
MDVVDQWTGRHACALQFALRMTHDDLAQALGVARRTVASWHERPGMILRTELQRALDTAYERASDSEKIRFARQVRADDASEFTTRADAAPLAVAIAIVVAEDDVLIVCRRDEDPSGISWQFPAGVVKPGANAATIAVRETLAETGVHCAVRRTLGSRVHPLSKVYCQYFLCEYLAGTVENRDSSENVSAIFVARRDLTRFIPADRIHQPVLVALEDIDDPAGQ